MNITSCKSHKWSFSLTKLLWLLFHHQIRCFYYYYSSYGMRSICVWNSIILQLLSRRWKMLHILFEREVVIICLRQISITSENVSLVWYSSWERHEVRSNYAYNFLKASLSESFLFLRFRKVNALSRRLNRIFCIDGISIV